MNFELTLFPVSVVFCALCFPFCLLCLCVRVTGNYLAARVHSQPPQVRFTCPTKIVTSCFYCAAAGLLCRSRTFGLRGCASIDIVACAFVVVFLLVLIGSFSSCRTPRDTARARATCSRRTTSPMASLPWVGTFKCTRCVGGHKSFCTVSNGCVSCGCFHLLHVRRLLLIRVRCRFTCDLGLPIGRRLR